MASGRLRAWYGEAKRGIAGVGKMVKTRRRRADFLTALTVLMVSYSLAWLAMLSVDLSSQRDYNAAWWVVRNAPNKWLYKAGALFRDGLSETEKNDRVVRFFDLNRRIEAMERVVADPRTPDAESAELLIELDAARDERDGIENSVEDILEGRLTAVLEDLGLESSPLGDHGPELVWPPVDFEFDGPPGVLVVSPRERIAVESQRLVRGDMTVEEKEALEESYRPKDRSALVAGVSGVSTYPATIPPDAEYLATLQTIAHEWLHHHLFFSPLGRRYFESDDLTTLNETVANMAGKEIGAMVAERYPLTTPDADALDVDLRQELRDLRVRVEALLAEGRVDEAEALMEERRRYLADHGYYYRKINQAFFAFHGRYADTPASIDPIGPKLQLLREHSEDVAAFVRAASRLTSEADLDALLAQSRGP